MTIVALAWREVLPRWTSVVVILATIFSFLLMGIAVMRSLDASLYESLPEPLLALAGIPRGANPAVMAYGQMLGFIAAMTVAGWAVAVGSQVIAGKLHDRTLPLLLSHPVSRLAAALAAAASLVVTVTLVALGLWGVAELAALPFDLSLGEAHLGALCLALGVNALLHGAVSYAVGAATGSRALALGTGSVVLALGWLLTGLLPLGPDADLARFLAWSWYARPAVFVHGLDVGYLSLSVGAAVGLLGFGVVAVVVRDLRPVRLSLPRPRLGTWRGPSLVLGRLGLALEQHVGLVGTVAVVMFAVMGLLMGSLYEQLAPQLRLASQTMPPQLLQLWGATDLSSPAGFYWGETMEIMAPLAVIVTGAAVARALASDEHAGRLGLVLAVRGARWQTLATTIVAQLILVTIVAVTTGLGIWSGARLANLDLPAGNIAGATCHLLALGLCVGSVAILVVAARGSQAAATWASTGVGLVGYLLNITLPMSPTTASWAAVSPFYFYAAHQPLAEGPHWPHIAGLLVVAAGLLTGSFPLFARRDLRA